MGFFLNSCKLQAASCKLQASIEALLNCRTTLQRRIAKNDNH